MGKVPRRAFAAILSWPCAVVFQKWPPKLTKSVALLQMRANWSISHHVTIGSPHEHVKFHAFYQFLYMATASGLIRCAFRDTHVEKIVFAFVSNGNFDFRLALRDHLRKKVHTPEHANVTNRDLVQSPVDFKSESQDVAQICVIIGRYWSRWLPSARKFFRSSLSAAD